MEITNAYFITANGYMQILFKLQNGAWFISGSSYGERAVQFIQINNSDAAEYINSAKENT